MRFNQAYRFADGHYLRWLNGIRHKGVDWAAPIGTEVLAAVKQKIVAFNLRGHLSTYGIWALAESMDGKYRMKYSHLSGLAYPRIGKVWEEGQVFAWVGNTGTATTGAHLDFEVYEKKNGQWVAIDPVVWLNKTLEKPEPQGMNVRKMFRSVWGRTPARGEELYFITRFAKGKATTYQEMIDDMTHWFKRVYPGGRFSFRGNVEWQREKFRFLHGGD